MAELEAARYRDVFAVPEFRAIFAAQLLSVVGDQFARVALAILVFTRTGSAAATALTYGLTFLPDIIARPLLSGLADRYPRRAVMIVTDLARAVLVAAMAVHGVPFVWLCVLLVAVQMLAAPFEAARGAVLPQVFGDQDDPRYPVANSIANQTYQAAQLLGFAAGGLLVVGVSTSGALLLDAATFVLSALILRFGMRLRSAAAAGSAGLMGWASRVSAGGRLVWSSRKLRLLVCVLCIPAFPVTLEGLAVPYAAELSVPPAAIGLLFAAEPTGSLLGMWLIGRMRHELQLRLMRPLAVGSCAVLIFCILRPGLEVTVVLWGLSGVLSAYFVTANAEFVRSVPDRQRGQALGLAGTACRVSQGLGVLAAGVFADVVQPAAAIAAAGVIGAVFALRVSGTRSWELASPAGAAAPADGVA